MNLEITDLIKVFGGMTLITTGISTWLGKIMSDKLNTKWKNEKDVELSKLKDTLSKNQTLLNASMTMISQGFQVSYERRLQAVEVVWESILKMREYFSPLNFFFSIFLPSEYNDVSLSEKGMLANFDINESVSLISELNKTVEKYRPFLGEEIWSLFFTYNAIMGRIIFLYFQQKNKRDIKHWSNDINVVNLFKNAIGDKINTINLKDINSLNIIISILEQEILILINRITNGEKASEINLEHAQKLILEASKVGKINNKFQ